MLQCHNSVFFIIDVIDSCLVGYSHVCTAAALDSVLEIQRLIFIAGMFLQRTTGTSKRRGRE